MFMTALARADSRLRCRRRRRRSSSSSSSTGDGRRRTSSWLWRRIRHRRPSRRRRWRRLLCRGLLCSRRRRWRRLLCTCRLCQVCCRRRRGGVAATAPPALWRAGRRMEGPDQDDGGESMRMRPCRDAPPRAQSEKPHNVKGKRYWRWPPRTAKGRAANR